MKQSHIVLLIVVAVLIGGILSTFGDASVYVNFKLAENNMGEEYTVVGSLDTTSEIHFTPKTTMLRFTAVDDSGMSRTVYYNEPKPQDFERSEFITMTGFATDTGFVATRILMKCPSKYNDQNRMNGNDNSYSDEAL